MWKKFIVCCDLYPLIAGFSEIVRNIYDANNIGHESCLEPDSIFGANIAGLLSAVGWY